MAATDTSKSERKERLDCILDRLEDGEEFAVYDLVAMFRISSTTARRDMYELERYHNVKRRREATGKTGSDEVVWYVPRGE